MARKAGPFRIVGRAYDDEGRKRRHHWRLQHAEDSEVQIVRHSSQIHRYALRDGAEPERGDGDDEVHVVHSIVEDERGEGDEVWRFRLRWAGRDGRSDTWVRLEDMDGAQDLLAEYWRIRPARARAFERRRRQVAALRGAHAEGNRRARATPQQPKSGPPKRARPLPPAAEQGVPQPRHRHMWAELEQAIVDTAPGRVARLRGPGAAAHRAERVQRWKLDAQWQQRALDRLVTASMRRWGPARQATCPQTVPAMEEMAGRAVEYLLQHGHL